MSEISPRSYQAISRDVEQGGGVSLKRFYVHLSGKTNGADRFWVSKLRYAGQIEVNSPKDSDYVLLFCPITSRVGTDINEALDNIPDDKPVVLVVMHHTFSRDYVVSESRRLFSDPKVLLVVDTLFFEGRPLDCNLNNIAWDEIKSVLGAEVPSCVPSEDCLTRHKMKILIGAGVVVFVILVGSLAGALA